MPEKIQLSANFNVHEALRAQLMNAGIPECNISGIIKLLGYESILEGGEKSTYIEENLKHDTFSLLSR